MTETIETEVYGKQEAFDVLKPSLTKVIQKWMNENCDSNAWATLETYMGDNSAGCMSSAAIAVLHGIVDASDYLKKDGQLKPD